MVDRSDLAQRADARSAYIKSLMYTKLLSYGRSSQPRLRVANPVESLT